MLLNKKKIAAIALGAMISAAGTAFAAEGADAFVDVPKSHWSYEALDYLAKEGIIEGMGDNTFQGGRTMTRYEMAAIVYRAVQHGGDDFGAKSVLDRLSQEYSNEISTLKQQVDKNTQDIEEIKKWQDRVKLYGFLRVQWQDDNRDKGDTYADENVNRRVMLDLRGDMQVNDQWTGHFDVEAKQHYTRPSMRVWDGTQTRGETLHEDGTFKRFWLDGHFKNGLDVTVGRRWTPMGMNFTMLGADTVGIDATIPITKRGLRFGGFYYDMDEYSNADFNFYGPIIKGPIGHNFDIVAAYAKLNRSKGEAIQVPYNSGLYDRGNFIGSHAFLFGIGTNVAKNFRLSADFVQTNHSYESDGHAANINGNTEDNKRAYTAKLDYKWTNPDVVHSFGAFARYHYIGRNGTIWNDDNDGLMLRNSRGWTLGFRYVPWKHITWGVDYTIANANMAPWEKSTDSWNNQPYKRKTIRTQLDFNF